MLSWTDGVRICLQHVLVVLVVRLIHSILPPTLNAAISLTFVLSLFNGIEYGSIQWITIHLLYRRSMIIDEE